MIFNSQSHKYNSTRNIVYAKNGAVATSTPAAAQAGLDTLKMGGNAVDAAIATAAALTVVEPTGNGIGGDAFAIVWIEEEKKLYGLNSSGFAPEKMKIEEYWGLDSIPTYGLKSVTVPGVPAAWVELNKKYGTLSLLECLTPAINYARGGFAVSPNVSKLWERGYSIYKKEIIHEELKFWFETFAKNDKVPQPGDIFYNIDLAKTLEEIAGTDGDSFYKGNLADKIEDFFIEYGGYLRKSDLEKFQPEWIEPISTEYKGYTVYEMPPNGHGITVLMALNILKEFKLDSERDTSENFHKIIESLKLSFIDAQSYVTDISCMNVKVEALLNDEYAKKRSESIKYKAMNPQRGNPSCGGTVYLATADSKGNMVSYIQSNYMGFGSGVVIPGTGITFNNRGKSFSLDTNHHNVLEPFKRPYNTIIPGFLCKENSAIGPFGVMGGYMQPQGHIQVLTNIIDFGLNPQEALDAPRWQWVGSKTVEVEAEMDENITRELRDRGHDVKIVSDSSFMGRGEIIFKTSQGTYACATESRCDGQIASW